MAWALVTDIERTVGMWVIDPEGGTDPAGNPTPKSVWQEFLFEPGTITSIIVLQEGHDYIVPDTYRLEEVPEDAKIGDTGY